MANLMLKLPSIPPHIISLNILLYIKYKGHLSITYNFKIAT